MLKFSANLGFLWPDLPLLDRLDAAAGAGFRAVELHWPFDTEAGAVRAACARLGLTLLGVNTPPGDRARGDFGLAAIPGREAEFRDAFALAAVWAREAGASSIHVMAGVPADRVKARTVLLDNLVFAAAEAPDLTLLLEAINDQDCPGYFYSRQEDVLDIVETAGLDNLRMMFDCYHAGRMRQDVSALLARCFQAIGHVQIAAVPDRGEPGRGDLDHTSVFARLNELGYSGWIGCEYRPRGDTDTGLSWMDVLGVRHAGP
jgi:hydroxypyruvate isomerase